MIEKVTVGTEFKKLLSSLNLDESSSKKITQESKSIISQSLLDIKKRKDKKTGLVIGYIQSGKTLSFTSVSCLARDNNFPLIIIIAGTSTSLFEQTVSRLKRDLIIDTRKDRKWSIFENPKSITEEESIEISLQTWADESIPDDEKQSTLIVIMKHYSHIQNLSSILNRINSDLKKKPTLIIDDEADQAGLNTNASQDTKELSTTHSKLLELRDALPYHTYLQYTATPQAPLLIEFIDVLSPEFAQLLTPGEEYIGGTDLFSVPRIINVIPDNEIPGRDNPISSPPSSLLRALKIFYTSVAANYCNGDTQGNRSMMVHPSRLIMDHAQYSEWINSIKHQWLNLLDQTPGDSDQYDLINSFEDEGYKDLKETVNNFPQFDAIRKNLKRSIRQTSITELNTSRGSTPTVLWCSNYSHILIGGQSMDRGYTVEGLTVTYMPRGPGVGNADTIQQRARFYGYKKDYLGHCRIFLENNSLSAFQSYVDHESDLRNSLSEHISANKPLKDWKRVFFLDSNLRPTRRNILKMDCRRGLYSDSWFEQKAPHLSANIENNKKIVNNLSETFRFVEDVGHENRTDAQRHCVSKKIPLIQLYKDYLTEYIMSKNDSDRYTRVLLQIASFLQDHDSEECEIYLINSRKPRLRSVSESGEISQLFQGEAPVAPKRLRGATYPGDRDIKNNEQLTIQVHTLDIRFEGELIHKEVPTLAIWVPSQYDEKPWMYQPDKENIKCQNL